MARRSPEQILAVLEEQAREDEAFEAQVHALGAMSDAQLDDHLRGLGLDPEQLEREALSLFIAAPPRADDPVPSAVQAVPQQAPRAFTADTRRRRPLSVALWLAAGAAAVTSGGALIYALTHGGTEQPGPPAPAPSPSEVPSSPSAPLPVGVAPADAHNAASASPDAAKPPASNKPHNR